jgi:hypothetical protein
LPLQVPQLTPQRDRLCRFFTKSVDALYAGLLVPFQGKYMGGELPLVLTGDWELNEDTARRTPSLSHPRPIGGGVPPKPGGNAFILIWKRQGRLGDLQKGFLALV